MKGMQIIGLGLSIIALFLVYSFLGSLGEDTPPGAGFAVILFSFIIIPLICIAFLLVVPSTIKIAVSCFTQRKIFINRFWTSMLAINAMFSILYLYGAVLLIKTLL